MTDKSVSSFDNIINDHMPEQMKLLIPSYFYPGPEWDRLADKVSEIPGQIYIIANPDNGPGKKKNPDYENAINNFREKGGRAVGYVYTQYAGRNVRKVYKDIKRWYSFYTIDGIFFDEQNNTPGQEGYYQNLYDYVKQTDADALIFGNPGSDTVENYLYLNSKRVTDTVCLFENESDFLSWKPPSWTNSFSAKNFAILAYNADRSVFRQYADHAKSENIGWLYLTDAAMPNPWDRLASYFEEMCDCIKDK